MRPGSASHPHFCDENVERLDRRAVDRRHQEARAGQLHVAVEDERDDGHARVRDVGERERRVGSHSRQQPGRCGSRRRDDDGVDSFLAVDERDEPAGAGSFDVADHGAGPDLGIRGIGAVPPAAARRRRRGRRRRVRPAGSATAAAAPASRSSPRARIDWSRRPPATARRRGLHRRHPAAVPPVGRAPRRRPDRGRTRPPRRRPSAPGPVARPAVCSTMPDAIRASTSAGMPMTVGGIGRSASRVQIAAEMVAGCTIASPRPISAQRSVASGRRASRASAPTSRVSPSTSASRSLPPSRSEPSSSSTSAPARPSSYAAVSPATPPPTTAILIDPRRRAS